MLVREVFSELDKDGNRVLGERMVEMPNVMNPEEARVETHKRDSAERVRVLLAASAADLIDALDGDAAALARVKVVAAEVRRLRAEADGRTPPDTPPGKSTEVLRTSQS
jgi:hypothetical protein